MGQSVLASRSCSLLLPRLSLAALVLAINAEVAAAELVTRSQGACPDVSGHFRVTEISQTQADALARLRITRCVGQVLARHVAGKFAPEGL